MIVIGGLGSVRGAVFGAAFVTALPLVLSQYSDSIGFLSQPGQGGVGCREFSNYVYGGRSCWSSWWPRAECPPWPLADRVAGPPKPRDAARAGARIAATQR